MPTSSTFAISTSQSSRPRVHCPRVNAMMPSATHQLGHSGCEAIWKPGISRVSTIACSLSPITCVVSRPESNDTAAAAAATTPHQNARLRGSQRAPSRHTIVPSPAHSNTIGTEKTIVHTEK